MRNELEVAVATVSAKTAGLAPAPIAILTDSGQFDITCARPGSSVIRLEYPSFSTEFGVNVY